MKTINVGVIGCGHWGPNHVRNFSHLAGSRALMCADRNPNRLRVMKETFRNIHPTKNYRDILRHPDINAVVISTQAATHYQIARDSLLAGKDVLCEKPMCLAVKEAQELNDLAARKKRILMLSHVFLFNAGIRKFKDLIQKGSCGSPLYLHSERIGLGPIRNDCNAA